MTELILATNNKHKLEEFSNIFKTDINLISLEELGFKDEIIEDGDTFIENSLIKCRSLYAQYKKPVLADDSGLCVLSLNNEPGIFSARYGGEDLSDTQRYEHLLANLQGIEDRRASFVCALTLFLGENRFFIVKEEVRGVITESPKGTNGFGYDPIFYIKELNKTTAQLSDEEKNIISHRGKAAKVMKQIINAINL